MRSAPAPTSPKQLRELNQTRRRPAFWMAFAWSTQFAHFTLEHLPRMWYYGQLRRQLPQHQPPPILVVPPRLSAWQSAVLRALSVPSGEPSLGAGTAGVASSRATHAGPSGSSHRAPVPAMLLTLQPPHWFSSLYIPGMLSHIGLLWTPQALAAWERVRHFAGASRRLPPVPIPPLSSPSTPKQPRRLSTATHYAVRVAGGRLLYSLRGAGGRSAGGARVLADQPALVAGLRAMGFAPAKLDAPSLAEKVSTLRGAAVLVVECGSALANAMLLPRGLILIVLCMREHTSSEGCYGQLLASRFTAAPVYTLRVGEPIDAPSDYAARATTKNLQFNTRPHARWSLSVPQTLSAIAHLAGAPPNEESSVGGAVAGDGKHGKGGVSRLSWPPTPTCAASHSLTPDGGVIDGSSASPTANIPTASARAASRAWWRSPEELYLPHQGSFNRGEQSADHGTHRVRRSRVFSLVPCADAQWAAPRCWELRTATSSLDFSLPGKPRATPRLEWVACAREVHCTRWRWCTRERQTNVTQDASRGVHDSRVDCEQRHATRTRLHNHL